MAIGFVDDGRLYSVEVEGGPKRRYFDATILNSIAFSKAVQGLVISKKDVTRYRVDYFKNAQYRWRISHGCFWGTGDKVTYRINSLKRIPLEELAFFDTKNAQGNKLYREKHSKSPEWYFDPVVETAEAALHEKRGGEPESRVFPGDPQGTPIYGPIYFDFLPTSETSFILFIWRRKKIHVWNAVAVKSKGKSEEYDILCREDKHQTLSAEFSEPFHVFGNNERAYYFVTRSGKLYGALKFGRSLADEQAKALWTDEKSPIRTVICDTASDRTFAFTEPAKKDAKDGQRVYFELAGKIETKPYERVPVDGLTEPLKTVMEYAQVLVKDKKIK